MNYKYFSYDICVCCGNPVPEGSMVCNICKQRVINAKSKNNKNNKMPSRKI